jgi:hypothetical protein
MPLKEKPKPKPKTETKPKKDSKPKKKTDPKPKTSQRTSGGITVIRDLGDNTESTIDHFYERKVNALIKRIKEQNEYNNEKIRFGWSHT